MSTGPARGYGFGVDMNVLPGGGDGGATRYYPARWRLLLLVLTCAFLIAVFLLPALNAGPVLAGISWVIVLLLGLAGLVLLWRAVRPGPSVVLDRDGITDRTTLAPVGLVRWEEITVIRKKEIGRGLGAERLLEVVLADPDEFRARSRGWLWRATDRYRAALRHPVVSIPGSMVSVPMQVLMDDIRQRQPRLQVLEGPPPPPSKLHMFRRGQQPRRKHPDLPRW